MLLFNMYLQYSFSQGKQGEGMLKRFKSRQSVSRESVLDMLRSVTLPDRKENIVDPGMVQGINISSDGHVVFMIEVDPSEGATLEPLRQKAEQVVQSMPGVKSVRAVLTAQKKPDRVPDPHGMDKNPKLNLPIKKIIAVASGKGGVGKSTVAAGLAIGLAKEGYGVGLLDADIYGPSQPRMMGLEGQKPVQKSNKIEPLEAYGVKVMSIGFMVDTKKALVWRGPMVQSAIYQLLRDVAWGTEEKPLDFLIVDMPPGTGDAQLTMAQKVPLGGAIVVSTPQDIALLDARKGVEMFEAVKVPVLGIIENMSMFVCANCGHETHIFNHGGAKKEAEALGVPFLGEIPLDIAIRKAGDKGCPIPQDFSGIISFLEKSL